VTTLAATPARLATWPDIPQPGFPSGASLAAEETCELVGPTGSATRVRLVGFDPGAHTISLQTPQGRSAVGVRFEQFQRLDLLEPVRPLPLPEDTEARKYRPELYCVTHPSGRRSFGLTLGVVDQAQGVFLFEPTDEQAAVRRVFIPREAIKALDTGPQAQALMLEGTQGMAPASHTGREGQGPEHPAEAGDAKAASAPDDAKDESGTKDAVHERTAATPEELEEAIARQTRGPIIPLGEALVALGQISAEQLQAAIVKQRAHRGVPLGELLVREGLVTRQGLQAALVRKMGYPVVDLSKFPAEPQALTRIGKSLATRLRALPLMIRQDRLVVAMEDPARAKALDEVEFAAGGKVIPVLAMSGTLSEGLERSYQNLGSAARLSRSGTAQPSADDAEVSSELLASLEQSSGDEAANEQGAIEQSDNSLVRLINSMILEAQSQGVSDIHIETLPGTQKVQIRFRRDGVLKPYMQLPHTFRSALLARIKVMCDLDISERRKPQDGKIAMSRFINGSRLELRVATIPTFGGLEDAVLRLLSASKLIPLDELGMSPDNLTRIKKVVQRPHGMFLCVGPTGSGKTTTLHSALGLINVPERKIWTAEDPIEITQPGLRQVQVNPKIGWTFDKALRSFLRADPDVIMVGEIRDQETAQVAIESSLTGHLVLSTLHTNSAPETVIRLLDMGMDPFNFGDSLLGVLAQRLVRRLCPHCRTARAATQLEIEELAGDYLNSFGEARTRPAAAALVGQWVERFGRDRQNLANGDASGQGVLVHYESPGCSKCGHTGFRGRAGIHELMMTTRELRLLIQSGTRTDELQKAALESGMRTLRQDGIEKVLAGVTSIQEVRATTSS
jgi:type II secretory ATPase GspE/PulE/Tfp pilus assembly ATPase PilB-like protein